MGLFLLCLSLLLSLSCGGLGPTCQFAVCAPTSPVTACDPVMFPCCETGMECKNNVCVGTSVAPTTTFPQPFGQNDIFTVKSRLAQNNFNIFVSSLFPSGYEPEATRQTVSFGIFQQNAVQVGTESCIAPCLNNATNPPLCDRVCVPCNCLVFYRPFQMEIILTVADIFPCLGAGTCTASPQFGVKTVSGLGSYDIDAAGTIRFHPDLSLMMSGGQEQLEAVPFNCISAKKRAPLVTITVILAPATFSTE